MQDWKSFSNVSVSLNQAATQLTVTTTDNSNVTRQATLPTSDPRVVLRAREGENRLFRIQASPSDLTFNVVTATNTNANSNNGPSGEGEGSADLLARNHSMNARSVDYAMAAPPVEIEGVINDVAQETSRLLSLADSRSRR
jgi:hypothetical protein